MASFCRSVVVAAARSAAVCSKALLPKHSPPRRASPLVCGLAALASVPIDSLMPLHSAVASARLKSYIAVDSSCWSCLSQGVGLDRQLKDPSTFPSRMVRQKSILLTNMKLTRVSMLDRVIAFVRMDDRHLENCSR